MRTFLMAIVVFALGCAGSAAKVERPSAPARPELGEYRIQAGDELEIRFPLNPELNVNSFVRPDGKISPKLIDEVYAEGRTPMELTAHLGNAYSSELRDPEIAVIVRSMAARVYVDGQIAKPGQYVWTRQITAMQAIARAGGFLDTADTTHIVVLRRSGDGAQQVIEIDLDDATSGKGDNIDVYLAPYDLVLVHESGVSEVNVWVDQYIRQNIPISPREVIYGF